MEKLNRLVSYDIESDKTRNRLASFLEKNGLRLHKSVFVVKIERHRFKKFLEDIKKIIGDKGDVIIAPLCQNCSERSIRVGGKLPDLYIF